MTADAPAGVERLVYSRDEVAVALGVSLRVIREWAARSADPLPCLRSRGRVLFPKAAVERWLLRQSGDVELLDTPDRPRALSV